MEDKRTSGRLNVLLLGSGGRESAMAWKLSCSPHLELLFIAPGNGGTEQYGTNVPDLNIKDFEAVGRFVIQHGIDLLVVGPEDPLVEGIATISKNAENYSPTYL